MLRILDKNMNTAFETGGLRVAAVICCERDGLEVLDGCMEEMITGGAKVSPVFAEAFKERMNFIAHLLRSPFFEHVRLVQPLPPLRNTRVRLSSALRNRSSKRRMRPETSCPPVMIRAACRLAWLGSMAIAFDSSRWILVASVGKNVWCPSDLGRRTPFFRCCGGAG